MREILFRGKDLNTGTWIEGFYVYHINRTPSPIGDRLRPGDEEHLLVKDAFSDWNMPRGIDGHRVNPKTVGQYTGLKDKHGKHIFEGDVVRYTKRQFDGSDAYSTGAVDFMEGCFAVCDYCLNNWLWNGSDGNTQLSEIEVVGNIHDNPELLGGINDAAD